MDLGILLHVILFIEEPIDTVVDELSIGSLT